MTQTQHRQPQYWNLLSNEDKAVYEHIRTALSAPISRNRRGQRLAEFSEILEALQIFVCADADSKWKRCLVCGFCILPQAIAVNTTQLKRLIFKCKSTINGSLKRLGFDIIITHSWAYDGLAEQIPYLRNNSSELRQWTIRISSIPCLWKRIGPVEIPFPSDSESPSVDEISDFLDYFDI
jgi:hypothetical protein